jgi:hypothetical protein
VLADQEPFATDAIRALERQGTGVMQFHPEYSTGQFEISVPHRAGIAVADTNLVARHTIRAVARANGLAVSFAPVVFAGLVGNGDHLHLSLWDRRGRNRFAGGDGPEGMTREAEAFAAGILGSLPAIVGCLVPVGRELPSAPAAPVGGPVQGVGPREPRGRAPVRDGDDRQPLGGGEPGGQARGRERQPVPGPRGDRRGRPRRARTRPAAPRADRR